MLNKRSLTTSLVAMALLLAMVLCCTLSVTYATADSFEDWGEVGIQTTALSDSDYSRYTDKELPSDIDKDNIAEYVPVDKFNTNGTTVYSGRNYGFVIHSDTGTNHVLLFKEIYTPHDDGDGYEVTLKVVYENSFFKSGNNILYAVSPYHISLTNIKFSNFIYDADMNNNIAYQGYDREKDTGAYFTQVRYENQFSYYDNRLAFDTTLSVCSFVADVLDCIPTPATAIAGGIINYVTSTISNGLLTYDILSTDKLWAVNSKFDTDIDLPLSRRGQIEKYGSLTKSMSIDVQADSQEYLSYDNGGGFARAIFRVMNDNNKDYYIGNQISFNISRYNGAEHHNVDSATIESVYSVTGTDCNQYSHVTENDGNIEFESYQRFSPMAKTNLFNFIPGEEGNYSIMVPPSYYLTVDGVAQLDNWVHVGEDGCKIGIASSLGMKMGDKVYSRLLPQDFYNGEIAFANLLILKEQKLNINEPTQVGQLTYKIESSNLTHNDLYTLDAGENADYLDLYITDEDLNVVAKAVKKDGKLYVNYPMKANKLYSVICVNRSGETLDVTVVKESGLDIGFEMLLQENIPYADIEGLYYSFKPRYTHFYDIYNGQLYDENMYELLTDDVFLQSSETYFVWHNNQGNFGWGISTQHLYPYFELGETYYSENNFNEMIYFMPQMTALYQFDGGTYDVMSEEGFITDVTSCVLQKDKIHALFKRQIGGYVRIYLDSEELSLGENSIEATSPYSVYTISVEEYSRLDVTIDKSNDLFIYDEVFNKYVYDHGYALYPGNYYVIVKDSGAYNITIGEYIQEIEVTFLVDGEVYEDTSGAKYYYGKIATMPVPTKDGYDFNGWINDGKYITDSNGVTYGGLLADYLVLDADWTIRSVIMEINLGDDTAKLYWTGKGFSSKNQIAKFEGTVFNQLINMKSEFVKLDSGKKDGYFLSTFHYEKVSSITNVDYYEFTPVWEVERYFIEFILPNAQIYTSTRAVQYLEEITQRVFPAQAFDYMDARCYLEGWKTSDNSDKIEFALGNSLIDLTPNYGSEYNYDSTGDGINDCTLVRLTPSLGYVTYCIVINNKRYLISDIGYVIGGLGYYGYTESEYYGKNVLLEVLIGGANKSIRYEFNGGLVEKSDFMSLWQRGEKEVTVKAELVSEEVTVALTYSHSGSGNPTQYKGEKNVTLYPTYIRGYKFDEWTLDGNTISAVNYQTLGINQYYSKRSGVTLSKHLVAKGSRTEYKAKSSYTAKDEVVYIDISEKSSLLSMKITISASVKEVTLFGNSKYCSNTRIIIEERKTKLVINFDKVSIGAPHGESAIDASLCPELELYSYNSVTLEGGEASAKEGGVGITCKNLELSGYNFYIYGGYSLLNKYNGRAGIYGVGVKDEQGNDISKLIIGATNVNVTGGAGCSKYDQHKPTEEEKTTFESNGTIGSNGKNGTNGFKGSDGAVAIYFPGKVVLSAGSKLTCTGGAGGNGGNGTNGQKGGNGRSGTITSVYKAPGTGGAGGKGGDGGNGGQPMKYGSFTNNGQYNPVDGEGGQGGYGGYGAPGGASCKDYAGKTHAGTKGKDGDPGKAGTLGISTAA